MPLPVRSCGVVSHLSFSYSHGIVNLNLDHKEGLLKVSHLYCEFKFHNIYKRFCYFFIDSLSTKTRNKLNKRKCDNKKQ